MNYEHENEICSLMFLENFGESIPLWNSSDTEYSDVEPAHKTFDEFVKQLIKIADAGEIGDYCVELLDHSLIMACCVMPTEGVTKGQPTAIEHFRKLGFHEIPVPKYGKYLHGLIYFYITGVELAELLKPHRK